ncbi:MAG: TatD family hydrolase [Pirellulales bacterium]|nr:TatD family hydrolase [Pirellulales bacterium]
MLIDTHAHLDHDPFDNDRQLVIERSLAAGVTEIVVVGTTLAGSQRAVKLASEQACLYATVGIHPNHAAEAAPADWEEICQLAAHPRCVALGETGLDRYWDDTPFAQQQDYFDRHIQLSQQTGLPLVIHTRESLAETLEMLTAARQRGPVSGVLHSYTGDYASALMAIELGLYISFAGMVTFKKNTALREVARQIPTERILVETDSPYLAPEPVRGKRNEPANTRYTAECLARERGTSLAEFAALTTENARRLFRLGVAKNR